MQRMDDWLGLAESLNYDFQARHSCLNIFMRMLLKGQPHHDHLQVSALALAPNTGLV